MKLEGMTFLVTGGAGFIGSYLVKELLKHDVKKVIIYDNLVRGKLTNLESVITDKRLEINEIGGDITDYEILDHSLKNVDGVFHFAALWLMQCHEFPESAFKVNVVGSFNVIRACLKNNIKKLVISSSASVYGDAISEPMDELHPFLNKNFYGATKISQEALATAYYHRYGLNFLGLRYMNVYGPGQDYKGAYIAVMMKMLDSLNKNKSPVIFGDGSESFDFIYVKDCAKSNIKAMQSEISGEFYNIGTGKKTSLRNLAEKILELKKSKLSISYKPRLSNTFVKSRIGSIEKAKKDINFIAETKLEYGLEKLIEWYEKKIRK